MMTEPHIPLSNNGFSLLPAIFVPFNGVPTDKARPKDRDEKLRRILEDLDKHHDAVRRNMMYLATLQKEKLLNDAREALEEDKERNGANGVEIEHASRDSELQQDIEELLESLKETAVRGTSGKEYEYEEGDFDIPRKDSARGVIDAEGDATMSRMGDNATVKRNIHYELHTALQDLVMETAAQIETYDRHAETTKDYYRRALERHNAREGNASGNATATVSAEPIAPVNERRAGGILKNTNAEIRVDTETLARISKEEQRLPPNQQVQSAADSSQNPQRSSVDFSRDPRRNSVDSRMPPLQGTKDVWRR